MNVKFLSVICVLTLCLSLTACAPADDSAVTTTTAGVATTTTEVEATTTVTTTTATGEDVMSESVTTKSGTTTKAMTTTAQKAITTTTNELTTATTSIKVEYETGYEHLDHKVPLIKSPDLGFNPDPSDAPKPNFNKVYRVTDAPYNAKGDGTTNDRAAIQAAIDAAHKAGGGTVCLTGSKTFLTGNLFLRSNIVFYFEDGAVLQQSGNVEDYVLPSRNGVYSSFQPAFGHEKDLETGIPWDHMQFYNYPLLLASEGTENVTVSGKGSIRMHRGNDCNSTIHCFPIAMFKTKHFEISNITICNFSSYACYIKNCSNGLVKGVTINEPSDLNTDGISIANSQDIRVTECHLTTKDDGIYVTSLCCDPRGGVWYDSNTAVPPRNIEIDHNYCHLTRTDCKALAFILWGGSSADLRDTEVENIYIHNNYAYSLGVWNDNLYDNTSEQSAIKNIVFLNNNIGKIQQNFHDTVFTDIVGFSCPINFQNADFERTGEAYWTTRKNKNARSAGGDNQKVGQDGQWYGYIDNLDQGDAALYQGLQFLEGYQYTLTAKVQSSGDKTRFFVRDQMTQKLIASQEIINTKWEMMNFSFEVPKTGNYHIGIERGDAKKGWTRIDSVSLDWCSSRSDRDHVALVDKIPTGTEMWGEASARSELGTLFSTKVNGTVTKVLAFIGKQEKGTHYVSVWDAKTKKRITVQSYMWNIEEGQDGWQEFILPEPVRLTAGEKYVVSVTTGSDCTSAIGTNQLSTSKNMKYITVYRGVQLIGRTQICPSIQTKDNYFRDVYFIPDAQ